MAATPRLVAVFALTAALFVQNKDTFWQKFTAAAAEGDPKLLSTLIRKDPESAVWALAYQAQAYASSQQNTELGERIDKLIKAWHDAFNSKFFDLYFEDLRGLDIGQWNERQVATSRYNKLMQADAKLKKNELSEEDATKQVAEAAEVAGVFEVLNDRYLAAWCWFFAGCATDPAYRPKAPNAAAALENYTKAIKLREALDHRDDFYAGLFAKVEDLKIKVSKGGASGGSPASAPGKGPKEAGKPGADPAAAAKETFAPNSSWMKANAKFAVLMPGEIERPAFNADDNYLDWIAISIQGKADTKPSEKVPFFAVESAKFIRDGEQKFQLDPGDKKPIDLKLGRPSAVEFKIPLAGGVEYAFVVALPSNQEPFHGVAINAAPDESRANLYYCPAVSRSVELAGQKLRIFDDSYDGKFGGEPLELKDFRNRMTGPLPLIDSYALGTSTRALPFSSYMKLGDKWYRVKGDSDGLGKGFMAREVVIPTGRLKVDWKGPAAFKPKYVVVKETGDFTGSYFDLMSGGDKGVEVPAGEYELYFGTFRNGKAKQMQKYLIVPGAQPKPVKVKAGATETLTLGAPFTFGFKPKQDGGEVKIAGKSVEIRGSAGERYVLLSDETPKPTVEMRKPGAKGGDKLGTMKLVQIDSKRDANDLWSPEDFKQKKPDGAALEIRLVEEHKWFGPVASDWVK